MVQDKKLTDEIEETRATTPDKADRFDKRAKTYWDEMFGLLDLLNFNNQKVIIRSVESPIITNYLLWRILNELKVIKEGSVTTQNANTRIVGTREH